MNQSTSKIRMILFLFSLLFIVYIAEAQTTDFDKVRNSDQYIWGYGESEDYDKANKNALEGLISKISVHVESKFEYVAQEDNFDFREYTKSVISTYSSATLTDTKEQMYERKGIFYVLRYIETDGLQKIFAHRESKIRDYLHLGTNAEEELRIGDALRYYYWSYVLYLSHPYRADLKVLDNNREILVGLLLNDKMASLFSKVNFQIINRYIEKDDNKTKLILACTFDSKKVSNLDFRYNSGGRLSAPHEVSNGISEVFLYGAEQEALESLNLRIEYKYITKSYQDKELSSVLDAVNIPFFKGSAKSINLPISSVKKLNLKKSIAPKFETVNKLEDSKRYYSKTIKNLLVSIAEKDYSSAYEHFTPQGKEMFTKLIQYGNVSISPLQDTLKIIQLSDETVVRSVPMAFYFPRSNKQFKENVVFTFNKQRKIDAISFSISDVVISSIVNKGVGFGTVKDKYTLIKFLEFYKTAYSLKRLEYIESIFSDNALIIVGTVLKHAQPIDGMYVKLGGEGVKYQRYSKKEYISRLGNVFNSKEYINIDFDEARVRKLNGDEKIYGIQISQHYYSSSYSDFGYLFLMIDLNDPLKPTIYVRTWQPKKNADGSIYGLADFRMN